MPNYFFEISDGTETKEDEIGLRCRTLKDAREAAFKALQDAFHDERITSDLRELSITVRDQSGRRLFRTGISWTLAWLDDEEGERRLDGADGRATAQDRQSPEESTGMPSDPPRDTDFPRRS
ncbi:MAG: DUF6894 family protein [Pararhizobium sp.]